MDFKKATELFKDPLFDGEPVVIYEPDGDDPPVPPDPPPGDDDSGDDDVDTTARKYIFNNVEVTIVAERVEYIGNDGKLVTESYTDFSKKQIHSEFASLNDFLTSWNSAAKRKWLLICWKNMVWS